jgi:hypothetical protein
LVVLPPRLPASLTLISPLDSLLAITITKSLISRLIYKNMPK